MLKTGRSSCCALISAGGLMVLTGVLTTLSGCEAKTAVGKTVTTFKPVTEEETAPAEDSSPVVEVMHPSAGGVDRTCEQPGTVEPFESVSLYAKASGFLLEQNVDIGDHVKKGQLLVRISVPEYATAVDREKASVTRAQAKIRQMKAHQQSAVAEAEAAKSQIENAQADLSAKSAYEQFRDKQFKRIRELRDQKAVDDRLVDEKEDQHEAALAAANAAKAALVSAKQQAAAAAARVIRAEADVEDAEAELLVAKADLEKAQVLLAYTEIRAPFDGVITSRGYFPGDFIRSADSGNSSGPLLSVERTDVMRIVVQVPDRDVPYVTPGDEATVEIDALPGRQFHAKVSRSADSEDGATRTMRTEIDVPNKDGLLRTGMYGSRTTIVLHKGSPNAVTIPSGATLSRGDDHSATVRVVRNGKLVTQSVKLGVDNGIRVEVVEGLAANDAVVIRPSVRLADGTPVTVHESASGKNSQDHHT